MAVANTATSPPQRPLTGLKVLEFVGQGPGPWGAMALSDMGAEVVRIDRPSPMEDASLELQEGVLRNRRSLALDLKDPAGAETALFLLDQADALIEGFRPGVMERLGLGPDICLARNEKLVYGRITGWGQTGPWAEIAGHDLNYLAKSGLLSAIGPADGPPSPPLALVGDYGGGGALLAFGVVCALYEARASGHGQVVDAAMIDGISQLGSLIYAWVQGGRWKERRESNLLDGGAPFNRTYQTSDGKWVAVAAIEPKFFRILVEAIGLDVEDLPEQYDECQWPDLTRRLAEVFETRTRDEWTAALPQLDTCFAPVLTPSEAMKDDHAIEREAFVKHGDGLLPAPAPRLSRTPAAITRSAARPGEHSSEILREWGVPEDRLSELVSRGAVIQA